MSDLTRRQFLEATAAGGALLAAHLAARSAMAAFARRCRPASDEGSPNAYSLIAPRKIPLMKYRWMKG